MSIREHLATVKSGKLYLDDTDSMGPTRFAESVEVITIFLKTLTSDEYGGFH